MMKLLTWSMVCLCVNSRLVITSMKYWTGENFSEGPLNEIEGSVTSHYENLPVLNVKVIREDPLEIQLTALEGF